VLRSRPVRLPKPGDFDLVEAPLPAPKDGEILSRTIYLSLDPYMRGRISGGKLYAASVEPGQVMVGGITPSRTSPDSSDSFGYSLSKGMAFP
jgi:NADPH-dependent curcumin reductase CurA